jgi:penicillin-insensitive murein DD-endopeptidase
MNRYAQHHYYFLLKITGITTAFMCLTLGLPTTGQAASNCFGSVGGGRVEGAVKLPASGKNFSAYSPLGVAAGRTYVHTQVAGILRQSYAALAISQPDVRYVYGETGFQLGGRFKPHRTHQNGTSVDFFVPVRNAAGASVALPAQLSNRFGYDIEFDANGTFGEYRIDFSALAEHLYELDLAAKAQLGNQGLALVILDAAYLPVVFATKRGAYLKAKLRFMKGKPWVRHDEHYHVDFAVPCATEKP